MKFRKKTKSSPFCATIKTRSKSIFSDYMNEMKPNICIQNRKLIYGWTDKKNYKTHYRMRYFFYVKHGTVVDKVHEIISFGQSKWFERNIDLTTQKKNQAVKILKKTSLNYS